MNEPIVLVAWGIWTAAHIAGAGAALNAFIRHKHRFYLAFSVSWIVFAAVRWLVFIEPGSVVQYVYAITLILGTLIWLYALWLTYRWLRGKKVTIVSIPSKFSFIEADRRSEDETVRYNFFHR